MEIGNERLLTEFYSKLSCKMQKNPPKIIHFSLKLKCFPLICSMAKIPKFPGEGQKFFPGNGELKLTDHPYLYRKGAFLLILSLRHFISH